MPMPLALGRSLGGGGSYERVTPVDTHSARLRAQSTLVGYRGTSLTRNSAPLRPYSKNLHRALGWS